MASENNGAPWTEADVVRLHALAAEGHSVHAIAEALQRTYAGVVKRAVLERLSLDTRGKDKAA
jgi:hypothetical protein